MARLRDIDRVVATLRGDRTGDGLGFFEALQVEADAPFVCVSPDSPYASPYLELFDLSFNDYCPEIHDDKYPDQADDAFSGEFDRRLETVASWLESRQPAVLEKCKTLSIHLEVDIEIAITSYMGVQSPCFDIELSPRFLYACGRAGIPLYVHQEG
jgi:hypothetical protein